MHGQRLSLPRATLAVLLGVASAVAPAGARSAAAPVPSASGPRPDEGSALLRAALSIRYDCDLTARIRLTLRGRHGGERTRELEIATKRRGGRMHSIGRILSPEHLRGMAVMTIEAPDRPDDAFVYLPSLGRSRRIGVSRGFDSFLGSDLTYQDFERHRAGDYRVEGALAERRGGERVIRLLTRPRKRREYGRLDFVLAESDLAILEAVYFKSEGAVLRTVSMPRPFIQRHGRNLIPTRLEVTHALRGTSTSVEVHDLQVNPDIDDRLFSIVALESGRSLRFRQGHGPPGRERTVPD